MPVHRTDRVLWAMHPRTLPVPMPVAWGNGKTCQSAGRKLQQAGYSTGVYTRDVPPLAMRDDAFRELPEDWVPAIRGWEAAARVAGWPVPDDAGASDYVIRETDDRHADVIDPRHSSRPLGYVYLHDDGTWSAAWDVLAHHIELVRGVDRDEAINAIKYRREREKAVLITGR